MKVKHPFPMCYMDRREREIQSILYLLNSLTRCSIESIKTNKGVGQNKFQRRVTHLLLHRYLLKGASARKVKKEENGMFQVNL